MPETDSYDCFRFGKSDAELKSLDRGHSWVVGKHICTDGLDFHIDPWKPDYIWPIRNKHSAPFRWGKDHPKGWPIREIIHRERIKRGEDGDLLHPRPFSKEPTSNPPNWPEKAEE